jgi:hypothetical protein
MGTIGKRRNKEEERKEEWKNERKRLTLTGLLMEGHFDSLDRTSNKLRVRVHRYDPKSGDSSRSTENLYSSCVAADSWILSKGA